MRHRALAITALTMVALQALLCIASWVLSAMWPHLGIRNILTGEGMRWLLGRCAQGIASPPLAWLLLLAMAAGLLRHMGMGSLTKRQHRWQYRQRMALTVATGVALACIGIAIALVAPPQSILLSATGGLWPSPLANALVPMLAVAGSMVAVAYGIVAGKFNSVVDVYNAMVEGIAKAAPLFLFYALAALLLHTLCFVMPH